jgi:ribosomal protein S20
LASKPRGWTGARTPSAIKRVRVAERREAINGPRRSAAKTYVAKALRTATAGDEADAGVALALAMSALDKAAKVGAIHPNAAARRKSRLAVKINAALEGTHVQTSARVTKTTGKAAAAKAAKARVAAGKAVKAKGAQTAAGKARAALSKTARVEAAPATTPAATTTTAATPAKTRAASSTTAKAAAPKTAAPKATTTKAAAPKTSTAKASAPKAAAPKAAPKATTAKKAPAKATDKKTK